MRNQSSTQRNSTRSRGVDAHALRGTTGRNKDKLKSDRSANAGGNPTAQQDQFGSRHNADKLAAEQRRKGRPGGKSDLAFRESAQDTRPHRGAANKKGPARRSQKSGTPRKSK